MASLFKAFTTVFPRKSFVRGTNQNGTFSDDVGKSVGFPSRLGGLAASLWHLNIYSSYVQALMGYPSSGESYFRLTSCVQPTIVAKSNAGKALGEYHQEACSPS